MQLPEPPSGSASLLQGVCHGDEGAVRQLHRRYAGPLLALAWRAGLRDPQQATEDALLDVCRRAACHANSGLSEPAWIVALAQRHLRGCPARTEAAQETRRPTGLKDPAAP